MIGSASGIGFGFGLSIGKAGSQKAKTQVKPYIEPDVLESIYAVWQVSNAEPDKSGLGYYIPSVEYKGPAMRASGYTLQNGVFKPTGEGALVTISQEIVIQSEELTVISMVKSSSIDDSDITFNRFDITRDNLSASENKILGLNSDKYYILGYSIDRISEVDNGRNVTEILGDKNDPSFSHDRSFFNELAHFCSIPRGSNSIWYWTFIAKKALTDDQINQVIRYFNLDKYVEPLIYYNVEKQGLTNENYRQFNYSLKDLTGNGYDLKLYNVKWNTSSGIGGYAEDFTTWDTADSAPFVELTPTKIVIDKRASYYYIANDMQYKTILPMTVSISGIKEGEYIKYNYYENGKEERLEIRIDRDGIYNLPSSDYDHVKGYFIGFYIHNISGIITIEQIPIGENALVFDGIDDYGRYEGSLDLKDYTVIFDRSYRELSANQVAIISNIAESEIVDNTPFLIENINLGDIKPVSFGNKDILIDNINENRIISYQSTYKYNGKDIKRGDSTSKGDGLMIGGYYLNYSKLVLHNFLLYPYSLSEFLMHRQLERLKLTDPNEIEWRPQISSNVSYESIQFYLERRYGEPTLLELGNYYSMQGEVAIAAYIKPYGVDKPISISINNEDVSFYSEGAGIYKSEQLFPKTSPQIINITIDEYIHFEDIVQPYPMFLTFKVSPTSTSKEYSWGSKLKVGSFAIANRWDNQLWNLYNVGESNEILLNDEPVEDEKGYPAFYIQKKMVFTVRKNWSLDENSPKCILAPTVLKIPAASLKYLGYIPDISGNGNHGYLHNFDLYTQLDENGVLHFDGVGDYIDFPTMPRGGRQVFMKCNTSNWGSSRMLYDQRSSNNTENFGIFIGLSSTIAYNGKNSGDTYIDGVLNKYITPLDLANLTHNITAINRLEGPNNETTIPVIGADYTHNNYFANMKLHSFMLFDAISSDESILKLNEVIGIEGNYVEAPSWYYDTYNKTNSDADKAVITNKGGAVGDYDLNVMNVSYEGESGYSNNSLVLDGVDDYITNANVPVFDDYTYIFKRDIINHNTNINALSMVKGSKATPNKRAFIADLTNSATGENSYYSFGARLIDNTAKDMNIVYATKTSVNGKPITPGANIDDAGIEIAKWDSYKHMAFHKLVLYPVAIDNLSINMLRNMFEFDREIDLSSPIFKPYKEYSSIPNFSQFTLRDGITAKLLPITIEITNIKGLGPSYMAIEQPINFLFKPFTVNVEGLTDDVTLYYIYGKGGSISDIELSNGDNEISYHPDGDLPIGFAVACYEENLNCNITITLIN